MFQNTIYDIGIEINELLAQVEAAHLRQSQLIELDAQTESTLEQLKNVVGKIGHYAPDAIASLKSAVMGLFDSGDNGSDGGNQPTAPTPNTPSPDEAEPEIIALNGITGDCLTTAASAHPHEAQLNGQAYEWACPFACPVTFDETSLEGQCCDIDKAHRTGQHCTITPSTLKENENKGTLGEEMPKPSSTEMVHTSARTGYLKLKASGQILAAYAWFPRKDLAQAWEDWLDGMNLGSPELRLSQRNSSWKYEIKLTDLSMTQVERLASEDLSRKPFKKKETPAQAAGIEPPSDWGKPQAAIEQPQLFAKVLLKDSEYYGQTLPVSRVSSNSIGYTLKLPSGDTHWFRADVVQIMDADIEEIADPTEPAATDLTLDQRVEAAKKLQEESNERNGTITSAQWKELQALAKIGGLTQEQLGEIALIPYGYQRGGEIKAFQFEEIHQKLEKAALPTEPEPIEFNDVVEVVADSNDCVGLVGSFGRVKTVRNDRIGVEIDEQLVYFNRSELKVKAKTSYASTDATPTAYCISDKDAIYLQTNGNYLGTSKQTREYWEKAGVDPSDLIASMKANRPPKPAWDAAKYNPIERELALFCADDASDF